MNKLIPYILTFACIGFYCSNFNNPVRPTHIFNCYYEEEKHRYEVTISPTKVVLQSTSWLFPTMSEPIFTLYLKTDTDFTKKYSSLNGKNANFIYTVFLDSIIFDSTGQIDAYRYEIILSSSGKNNNDTNYYQIKDRNDIVIPLNNEYMDNPKKFLWQTYLYQIYYYTMPPEPYAHVVGNN